MNPARRQYNTGQKNLQFLSQGLANPLKILYLLTALSDFQFNMIRFLHKHEKSEVEGVDPNTPVLDYVRDHLDKIGTKEGCATGDCGACSVTVDGRLVCSCLMLGVEAEGHSVETIEGMADGDRLHPLQQKFLEYAALQCGICTPGFLIASKALLERNPDPTEEEARYWLAGNLCRCTGYDKIIRAVLDTAADMRGAS